MFNIDSKLLKTIADMDSPVPIGAYNIRKNGTSIGRQSSKNIEIISKTDKPGIDINIAPYTNGEEVHIPVILSEGGMTDLVYNDFYVGKGADVIIVAGCGIHNDTCSDCRHDGIHSFHVEEGAHVKYVEKHYGEGQGSGSRFLNPKTVVELGKNSYCEMEMVQISGVSSTKRETEVKIGEGAKLLITERLMTSDNEKAESDVDIYLEGEASSCRVIRRSVGKGDSVQLFHPRVFGNCACKAHVQCDSIIMDNSKISSIPEISANSPNAELVHEAAIGKINSDQLIKLMTFGLSESESEEVIIEGFLK